MKKINFENGVLVRVTHFLAGIAAHEILTYFCL